MAPPQPPRLLLLAEQHDATRLDLAQLLTGAGFKVLEAEGPDLALELASRQPDLALISIDLPKPTGDHRHLALALRDRPGLARLPIVALDHGHLRPAKGVAAVLGLDVNGYLPDPTDHGALLARLAALLATLPAAQELSGSALTLAQPPVQAGEVDRLTLIDLAHGLYELRRDGILVVRWKQLERRLFYLAGAPVAYQSSSPSDQLGRFLVDGGLLDDAHHQAALAAMAQDELSELQALVAVGALPSGDAAYAAVRRYLRAKAAELFAIRGGRFEFHPGGHFREELDLLEVPPLAPLRDAAIDGFPLRWMDDALRPHSSKFPRRSPAFAEILPLLGLSVEDLKAAMRIDGSRSCRQLVRSGLGHPRHLLGLLWILGRSGAVDFADVAESSGSRRPLEGLLAPRKRKPLPAEVADELRKLATSVLPGSYFAALGVDIAATPEEIERSARERSLRLHPETHAEFDLGDLDELLALARDRVAAAERVLSQPEKRAAYVRYLLARHGPRRGWAPTDPAAEVELKRGERLMRQGDFTAARGCFERAADRQPREPEIQAFLAWATFQSSDEDVARRAVRARRIVKKALQLNPTLERPLVIAGILEEALGNPAQARKLYLQALRQGGERELAKRALERLGARTASG